MRWAIGWRVSSIDDVLDVVGAALAAAASRHWWRAGWSDAGHR
jgi:phytoene/squalene synthetase